MQYTDNGCVTCEIIKKKKKTGNTHIYTASSYFKL